MKSTWDFLKWLWGYLRHYWYWLIVAFVGMVGYGASHGSLVFLLHEVAREIFEGDISRKLTVEIPQIPFFHPTATTVKLIEGEPFQILQMILLLALGALIIEIAAELASKLTMKVLAISVTRDVRRKLYNNIIERGISFFETRNVGDLLSRVSQDIGRLQSAINGSVRNLIQAPMEVVFVLAVAIYAAPVLAPAFLIVPLLGYAVIKVGAKIKKYSRQGQNVLGDMLSLMQERFAGIKLVKSLATEEEEKEYFDDKNRNYFRKNRRRIVADRALKTLLHVLIYSMGIVVFYLGGMMVLRWQILEPQGLIVFVTSLFWVYKPIRKVSGVYTQLQTARGAAERVEQIFAETRTIHSQLSAGNLEPDFQDKISFNDVSFSYPETEEAALEDINLQIERGENIALVGASGAGKSTLIDLLMRFYDPTEGEVTLDGTALPEFDLIEYRRLFGLVTQHPILFDGTIEANIAYGKEHVEHEQIVKAAEQAEAMKFIEDLPDGLQTEIGEGGIRLSGGERQRVTLARALVGEPQLLVLDEATSDVDSESEEAIIRAIQNLPKDMTMVTISHTLATVQFVDRIAVINDRTLEATGTHGELMDSSPTYRRLYEFQAI